MKNLKLDTQINQALVDGLLKGYKQYLGERKNKKEAMRVSGGYAWTKGNHIDDQISRIGQEHGIDFKIEKAGYTWEYLEFTISTCDIDSEEYILIVRNSKRVQKSLEELKKKSINHENYLSNYGKINASVLKSLSKNYQLRPEQIELELNSKDEINAIMHHSSISTSQNYSRFYIVTYEIDENTKLITSVKLTMLDSSTMELILIEDISYLISESQYEPTLEDVEPIKNENISDLTIFSGDENAFGYSVPEEEEKEEEN